MVPVDTVLKAQFITASAAARQMLRQGSGVIIFLTGSLARRHTPTTVVLLIDSEYVTGAVIPCDGGLRLR